MGEPRTKFKSDKTMSFLRGVLTGLAIGYLTAPRSGKETREKLTKNINDLQGQWEEGVSQVKEGVSQVKSQVDKLTGKAEAKVDQYADQAENKYDQYKNEAKTAYNQSWNKSDYNNAIDDTADAAHSAVSDAEDGLKFS